MQATRIVLVRHGESRVQELGILGGHDGCQGLSVHLVRYNDHAHLGAIDRRPHSI